jgi:sulfatase maturation enzyme AslB (radical SAM superfamily)
MSELQKQQHLNLHNRKQRELELLNSTPIFDIELSSMCNLSCVMCPRTKLSRNLEIMTLDLIKTLIDWLPSNAQAMLCGLGEPLLNKDIFFLISSLRKRDIEVGITTNGILLTENYTDMMMASGISLIQVSFNGSTDKTYGSIMKNGSFSTVMNNLQYLAKRKTPELTIKLAVTVQKENIDDIENIQALAAKLGFGVFLRNRHSRGGACAVNNSNQLVNLPGCGILPKVTFIAANGDVLSCCQDLAGKFVLGNINLNTFEEVLKEKKRIIDQDDWFPICKRCDDEYRYLLLTDNIV